jgi:serine/threonine protein kinase
MIKKSDLNLLEILHNKKNGLGMIHKSIYLNNEVACRVITFDRLSRYDLEGLQKDIEELSGINSQYVCNTLGVCVENIPNIYIVNPLFKLGSLYDVLHAQKMHIDLRKRMEIAKNIAFGMHYLHENKIFHYHLSSKNIYVNIFNIS